MKTLKTFGIAALCAVSSLVQANEAEQSDYVLDHSEGSYVIGSDVGAYLKSTGIDFDQDAFIRGLQHSLNDEELDVNAEQRTEIAKAISALRNETQQKLMAKEKVANLEEAEAFLAENGQRDGVITTESGLQYEVLMEGEGDSPSATDEVMVHYRGTLIDGTQFDSSYDRGQPVTFPLNRVIAGWTEGLQLMNKGAKYKFYIKPQLGYGEQGSRGRIPPNAALIFEVELVDIVTAEPATPDAS